MKSILALFVLIYGVLGDSYDYCQAPLPVYQAPEPVESKLLQLFVVSRHGDRTPLMVLPHEGEGAEAVEWSCGLIESTSLIGLGGNTAFSDFVLEYKPELVGPFAIGTWKGNCSTGQLTLHGAEQCLALGKALRSIYVDKLGFLPTAFSPALISVRSTDVWRTKQSLMSLLQGLYPPLTRNGQSIAIQSVPFGIETLFGNRNLCPRISELIEQAISTAEWIKRSSEVAPIVRKCDQAAQSNWNSAENWFDTLYARKCHQIPYPCPSPSLCVTEDDAQKIYDLIDWEYLNENPTEEGSKLAIGQLMATITEAMKTKVSTGNGPKYSHFSGHDSSINAIQMALKLPGRFPPYASHMIFELWQKPTSEIAVRVIYNGQLVKPPECPSFMCPFDNWVKMISSRLTIRNFTQECATKTMNPKNSLFGNFDK